MFAFDAGFAPEQEAENSLSIRASYMLSGATFERS